MNNTMNNTAERPASAASEIWNVWLASTKTMNWSADQMEVLTNSWLEQTKTMRHDGQKVLEVMVSQAKSNCDEAQRMTESMVKGAMQAVPGWDTLTMGDLRRQVEDLANRVETLEKK
jgi:polyhydroxyalkanoate synthesis regulator phasin